MANNTRHVARDGLKNKRNTCFSKVYKAAGDDLNNIWTVMLKEWLEYDKVRSEKAVSDIPRSLCGRCYSLGDDQLLLSANESQSTSRLQGSCGHAIG
jgi:hypothetical protein